MRCTRWSRIEEMEKSVASVIANSLSTDDSCLSSTIR